MTTLKNLYLEKICRKLTNKFNYINKHQIPKIQKIVISSGLGLNAQNSSYLQKAINEYRLICGQHPMLTKAKQSISGFKLRKGVTIGIFVTLRRQKMYSFLEKLIKLVLPRVKDFQGLSTQHFDTNGNYTFGINDQLVFPEIDYGDVEKRRGFNITIVTNSGNKLTAKTLLEELGFPFIKDNDGH